MASQFGQVARWIPAWFPAWFFLAAGSFFTQAFAAVDVSPQEQQIFELLRADSGQNRPGVSLDPILCKVARARAKDMATRHFFAHVNPDGVGPNLAVRRAGYKLPNWWGNDPAANYVESIAAGYTNAGSTWSAWMGSPHHKDHLLALNSFYANQTKVGVGYAFNNDDTYKHYWVVITAPPQPKPKVKITSPAKGDKVTTPEIEVLGNTSADPEPVVVEGRVEHFSGTSAFQPATGVSNWRLRTVSLAPGRNRIKVRTLKGDGSVIAETSTTVDYVVMKPLTVLIQGEGTVSKNLAGITSQELGQILQTVAKPAKGWLFAGWSGTISSSSAALSFRMEEGVVLTALFVPNPFIERGGSYLGVFSGGGQAGMVQVRLNQQGLFTGKLKLGGEKSGFSGKFSPEGIAQLELDGVALRLEVNGDQTVDVTVTDGANIMLTTANRTTRVVEKDTSELVFGEAEGIGAPTGEGLATVLIKKKGRVHFTGVLADGTAFSQGLQVTADGTVPVYISLYENGGSLVGVLPATAPVNGELLWIKTGVFSATVQVAEAP